MAILSWIILFCAVTFGALKPGFRSLATLELVVNVVGELQTKNSCDIARFPCDSTAFLFVFLPPVTGNCATALLYRINCSHKQSLKICPSCGPRSLSAGPSLVESTTVPKSRNWLTKIPFPHFPVDVFFYHSCLVPGRRPHRRQELATLPSVGANPKSPPFPYVDLETRSFAVLYFLCILVKIDSR